MVNGIFYPESCEAITGQLRSWGLKDGSARAVPALACTAKSKLICGEQAILAPHGAWELTGNIAGKAFGAVQEEERETGQPINRVLLISTYHYSADEGIYLSESASFETPLGDIQVDLELNKQMASSSNLVKVYDIPHLSEHALEVLLPLVKFCFPAAKIVPILAAGRGNTLITGLANALKTAAGKNEGKNLFVISSNVSQNPDPAIALSMAEKFSILISNMDTRAFMENLADGSISACGGAIMGALLESELLINKHFSSLCPLVKAIGENGEIVYNGAFYSA